MQTLTDRIRAFLKLTDACLEWFESPATPPIEPHPLFAGITPPKGFDGQEDYSEALDTIPHEILENGGWENELIEQARSIAGELARQEWGKDAVKTLLAFIRALKQRRTIDRELREQVRADLEDAAELLRINAGKPDGGKPNASKPAGDNNGRLREWLHSLPWDKIRPTIRQAAEQLGVKSTSSVAGLPAWKEEMAERERRKLPPKAREEVQLASGADRLLVDGQQRIPTDPLQDAMHAEAYCEGGDVFTDPEKFRALLLDCFDDESKTAREYRAGVNKLKPADLSALLGYLKEMLGGKLAYEQIELVSVCAAQWIDEHR